VFLQGGMALEGQLFQMRPKKTPVRGPAPAHPIAPAVVRVPYRNYGSFGSTQPMFMEFIPTPRFPKK